nr:MAG TPA: hypothetical protein [Caudoviricetes sp.]
MKKYIPTTKENHFLKVELYYTKGGINVFTYKTEARGYYLSVSPIERTRTDYGATLESYTAFSGVKKCVLEVSRKSQKQEARAEQLAADLEPVLIRHVLASSGLELAEGVQV